MTGLESHCRSSQRDSGHSYNTVTESRHTQLEKQAMWKGWKALEQDPEESVWGQRKLAMANK